MEHDLVPTQNSVRTSDMACALPLWLCAHILLTIYGNTYCTVANYVVTAIDKIDVCIDTVLTILQRFHTLGQV